MNYSRIQQALIPVMLCCAVFSTAMAADEVAAEKADTKETDCIPDVNLNEMKYKSWLENSKQRHLTRMQESKKSVYMPSSPRFEPLESPQWVKEKIGHHQSMSHQMPTYQPKPFRAYPENTKWVNERLQQHTKSQEVFKPSKQYSTEVDMPGNNFMKEKQERITQQRKKMSAMQKGYMYHPEAMTKFSTPVYERRPVKPDVSQDYGYARYGNAENLRYGKPGKPMHLQYGKPVMPNHSMTQPYGPYGKPAKPARPMDIQYGAPSKVARPMDFRYGKPGKPMHLQYGKPVIPGHSMTQAYGKPAKPARPMHLQYAAPSKIARPMDFRYGKPPRPAKPAPYYHGPYYTDSAMAVVKKETIADSDHDSVSDALDFCPDTVKNASVDGFGCAENEVIVLRGVNFETNSDKLTQDSISILNRVAKTLVDYAQIKLEVSGHTDSDGDDTYNKGLSQRRAETVRSYLVDKGVTADNLLARGYGEEKPLVSNDSSKNKAKNRRVELNRL